MSSTFGIHDWKSGSDNCLSSLKSRAHRLSPKNASFTKSRRNSESHTRKFCHQDCNNKNVSIQILRYARTIASFRFTDRTELLIHETLKWKKIDSTKTNLPSHVSGCPAFFVTFLSPMTANRFRNHAVVQRNGWFSIPYFRPPRPTFVSNPRWVN
jgi:hypothetical protein